MAMEIEDTAEVINHLMVGIIVAVINHPTVVDIIAITVVTEPTGCVSTATFMAQRLSKVATTGLTHNLAGITEAVWLVEVEPIGSANTATFEDQHRSIGEKNNP